MDIQEEKDRELNSKVLSKKEKGILKKWILSTLVFLFAFFSFFLYFSLYFLLNNWNELTVDEILYHLKAPMGGANGDLVRLFLLSVLLPSSVIVLLLFCFDYCRCLGEYFFGKLSSFADSVFYFHRRPLCGPQRD